MRKQGRTSRRLGEGVLGAAARVLGVAAVSTVFKEDVADPMPFDPHLADRMRDALRERAGIQEKKMFGGYC